MDKAYPEKLFDLSDPPEQVFCKGSILPEDEVAVAIVGSRLVSEYGKRVTKKFASDLAKVNFTIVSGLAKGVDTVAHTEALKANGRTIAVLGGSIEKIYPPQNKSLADKIAKNGALLTEFPKGSKPLPKNFLARNRIIAALARAVIVVEGKRRSGTLSTAKHAAELGREVFAIPGPVNSPLSEAPHYLIDNGARIARKPEDIFDILI